MIPLQRPYFDKQEERAVISVLRSGWVTQGPKVKQFEETVCKYTGAKYAVATTSCTTALHLSLYALGIGQGDEVLVPSFSFIATTNVVRHAGATPVFVDIESKTYNMDPNKLEEKITKKTKAIIPVHQVGLPADLDEIYKIAVKHKLKVVEDAACAMGSIYKGRRIGSFGKLVCFSFHPRKIITTGEGGMILTDSKQLADRLKSLRHHGMVVSDLTRHKSDKIIQESYSEVGYNFRMSDIQAAVGVEQIKKLPAILKKRLQIAGRYTEKFSKSKNIIPPFVLEGYTHNFQSYIIRLKNDKKISRDLLRKKLLSEGIATQIGIMASHLEPPYRRMYPKLTLPETQSAAKETITIPLYFQMTEKEQDFIISKILEISGG